MNKPLAMRGNLGKTILQLAAQFADPSSAAWEYINNSIEYRDKPDGCRVFIKTSVNEIIISDNGSGMNNEYLKSFFTVAGKSLARQGKQASWLKRGMYGTGKTAAFGIANELIVETNFEGIKNSYRLTRKAIEESPENANEIPVEALIENQKTDEDNGTTVTIRDLNVKIKDNDLIRKIEREISHMRNLDIKIAVNSQVCEFKELDIVSEHNFPSSGPIRERYGDFNLQISVSRAPLDPLDKGIKIMCNQNHVGLEDCGVCQKECGNLLTGFVDIPDLEKSINNIDSINQTRDGRLNTEHDGVHELLLFIAPKLEKIRKEVADKKEEEKNSIQSKKLTAITHDLSNKFNKEWNDFTKELNSIRVGSNAKSAMSAFYEPGSDSDLEALTAGRGVFAGSEEDIRFGEKSDEPITPSNDSQKILDESSSSLEEAARVPGKKVLRRRAGFIIDHDHLGADEQRSRYVKEDLKIIINMDHPTVASCLRACSGDVENITFKRLIFEISVREFEHAIGQEMVADNDLYAPSDLLFEMRTHFDRITRIIGPSLYQ